MQGGKDHKEEINEPGGGGDITASLFNAEYRFQATRKVSC